MEQGQNLLTSDIHVDEIAYGHLKETAKWGKFLGLLGFVLSGLLALVGIFAGSMITTLMERSGSTAGPVGAGTLTMIYIIGALIYFFMSLYLYRFAVKMQAALNTTNQETFNESLSNLRMLYRMMGIIMIIYLSILALAMIGGIIAAMFMG